MTFAPRRLGYRTGLAGNGQHFAELDGVVLTRLGLFDLEHVARGDTVLFSACADDSVHNFSPALLNNAGALFHRRQDIWRGRQNPIP